MTGMGQQGVELFRRNGAAGTIAARRARVVG
jgi:hypothetical protein